MRTIKTVLQVEDNTGDARLLREMFNEHHANEIQLLQVRRVSEAEKYLVNGTVDVILLDLRLPDADGLGALRRLVAVAPGVPLVVLTSWDDEGIAAQALQGGAQDYLLKGQIERRGLFRALRHAVERKAMEEALFAEKERAEVTLNSIGDAVACTDIAGNLTFLNAAAERMTGWSRQEAVGRPFAGLMRILDASSRETIANPTEIGRASCRERVYGTV